MGLEGFQRLVQFMKLLWCGLRVVRATPMALEEDGHENRFWGRDAERHEDGCVLLRVKAAIRPRRLGNAERRTEGRRCLFVHKVAREPLGSLADHVWEVVLDVGILEDGFGGLRGEGVQPIVDELDVANTWSYVGDVGAVGG